MGKVADQRISPRQFEPRDPSLYDTLGESRWQAVADHCQLTPRQSQIARLMCDGCTYEGIAHHAGLAVDTVRMHMRNLFKKLDAHDRVNVVVRLVQADQRLQDGSSNARMRA